MVTTTMLKVEFSMAVKTACSRLPSTLMSSRFNRQGESR